MSKLVEALRSASPADITDIEVLEAEIRKKIAQVTAPYQRELDHLRRIKQQLKVRFGLASAPPLNPGGKMLAVEKPAKAEAEFEPVPPRREPAKPPPLKMIEPEPEPEPEAATSFSQEDLETATKKLRDKMVKYLDHVGSPISRAVLIDAVAKGNPKLGMLALDSPWFVANRGFNGGMSLSDRGKARARQLAGEE